MILAEHRSLADEDREQLIERCRLRAGKLDRNLTDVENGRDPAEVRSEVDETVRKLVQALEQRATDVAARGPI